MPEIVDRATGFGDRVALVSEGREIPYAELDQASHQIAAGLLRKLGVADLAEARVAFLAAPGPDYVAVQWGIWRAGGVAIPLCTTHPSAEWQYVIEDSQAALLLVGPEFSSAPGGTPISQLMEGSASAELPRVTENRRAMMLYTSGTTGRPKGVVITHAQLRSQIETLVEAWAWTRSDRTVHVLPLHHTHGIVNVLCCGLWSGACLEMVRKFDAVAVWDRIASGDLTLFMAVPTIYAKLIQAWNSADSNTRVRWSRGARRLRLMVSGSAALPVPVFEGWETMTGHKLLERYGMTEIGMAISNPLHGERKPGTVGRPLPGVQVRRVDEGGRDVAAEEPGELWVSSPSVFQEYWNREEATRAAFVEDCGQRWFKTGDVGVLDDDGYFRLLGRRSVDIIKTGGYKVSALEIEERLRENPAVKDCAVVGLPDPEWGERVAVCLVLSGGDADLRAIQDWARHQMARYKVPSVWKIVAELPRNAMGKVLKPELKKLFERA